MINNWLIGQYANVQLAALPYLDVQLDIDILVHWHIGILAYWLIGILFSANVPNLSLNWII